MSEKGGSTIIEAVAKVVLAVVSVLALEKTIVLEKSVSICAPMGQECRETYSTSVYARCRRHQGGSGSESDEAFCEVHDE